MEPSESREPSYYEVALTNRQVLVAFVVLLSCVLAAFLSGVWIGRGGAVKAAAPAAVAQQLPSADPQLEQLTFFTGKEPGARTAAAARPTATAMPAPAGVTAPPATREDESGGEAMRRTLDAEVSAARATPAASRAASPVPAPAAAAAATRPAPAATAAAKPAAGKLFVQVYSSTNDARAKEIVAELRKAGFKVQLTDTPKAGGAQTNHRVRVGPYEARAAADAAATRLRREFRLDTWVTDTP